MCLQLGLIETWNFLIHFETRMWHHLLQSLNSCLMRSPHANAWPCWLIISRPMEEAARHLFVRVPRDSPMKLVLSVYIGSSALLARKTYSRYKRHGCCRSMVLLLLRDLRAIKRIFTPGLSYCTAWILKWQKFQKVNLKTQRNTQVSYIESHCRARHFQAQVVQS
jgi:hypothetical protein